MAYPAIKQRDRRRHRRYDVRGVRGSLVFPLQVKVLNMSLTGLAVESREALEIGTKYDCNLHNGREAVDVNVDVQWCHLVRTERSGTTDVRPVYQVGLDFRHVLNLQARELLRFLEHNIVIDTERRIFGRFRLGLDAPVKLGARHEFLVRKLSFSGMLIETDLAPEVGTAFDIEINPDDLRLRTRGKVVHSEAMRHKPGCRAGIQFLKMPPASRQTLTQLIERFLE